MSQITFDDGQSIDTDDIANWIDGLFDQDGNPVIVIVLKNFRSMTIPDTEFNRGLLPAKLTFGSKPKF